MALILWIIAVVLVIAGIVQLFQGQILLGIGLIVLGFLVGPGGVSLFATTPAGAMAALMPGLGRTGHLVSTGEGPDGVPGRGRWTDRSAPAL
ncbi:MAG TPA: GPGG-motif small membrane protein [Intrasporangium sp.]|uniref:GPGG-motif small membrane protein n=1 Tax=Intrasporangium sp. TaxID=1925024 RepID=UPI002B47113E|nr:GPGG-motif small membrane protein [Intrasporangium sp.]HKX67498.1 GPGG-motif small membrane protein [Intrasporangium sp.]